MGKRSKNTEEEESTTGSSSSIAKRTRSKSENAENFTTVESLNKPELTVSKRRSTFSRKLSKKKLSRSTLPSRDETSTNVEESTAITKRSKSPAFQNQAPYRIRPMELLDIHQVFQLGLNIFTSKEFPNMYRLWDDFAVIENLASSREYCYVAETYDENETDESTKKDREVIAFILGETMTKYSVGTRGYIQWVGVKKEFRRRHIATGLIEKFISVTKEHNVSMLLADTPATNTPAINMLEISGLTNKTDHVYLTKQICNEELSQKRVNEDGEFHFIYTVKKKILTIRNMEIKDLNSVYELGNQIFTSSFENIYNFWDDEAVMEYYLTDPDLCMVATVKEKDPSSKGEKVEKVIGFAFGTTIEKPKSSWKYGYLVWLGVDPMYQGMGLARELYDTMVELFAHEKVRMLMIDTQVNNESAIRFFRKLGFGHDEKYVYLCNKEQKDGKGDQGPYTCNSIAS
ncbi:hypothetical protein CTEN210_08989 [Chaetoceros tenuissimus]|uniref:N-acetyltransferase domain-containing protein n=1 Tax=Chaetoceros tenuissimus TaxID=426638 RepID=A0AAD3CV37_9STRA|nr:hypothetical protein CTEN210_08989 [Chaetoceros tenuissimus]